VCVLQGAWRASAIKSAMLFFYSSCLNFAATVLQSPEITLWFFEKIEKS
jgi:hypothetical protein